MSSNLSLPTFVRQCMVLMHTFRCTAMQLQLDRWWLSQGKNKKKIQMENPDKRSKCVMDRQGEREREKTAKTRKFNKTLHTNSNRTNNNNNIF